MKTVLITGGSRGIGRAAVELFRSEGYQVAFTYKESQKAAQELQEKCEALAILADSKNEKDIKAAVKKTAEAFGKIDILINNAGVSSSSLIQDITLDDWNECMSVNLTSAFLYSREVLPLMLKNHSGKIINITSIWGLCGASCELQYSTAKAGLIGMTKAMAKELGPSGITVNAIAPGVIDTDMNACYTADDIEALKDETPLGRIGTPSEIAKAMLFLAGDGGDFITGEVLNVSGGFVI